MQASPQHRALSLGTGAHRESSASGSMHLGRVLDEHRRELVRSAERDAVAGPDLVRDDTEAPESELSQER